MRFRLMPPPPPPPSPDGDEDRVVSLVGVILPPASRFETLLFVDENRYIPIGLTARWRGYIAINRGGTERFLPVGSERLARTTPRSYRCC